MKMIYFINHFPNLQILFISLTYNSDLTDLVKKAVHKSELKRIASKSSLQILYLSIHSLKQIILNK